MRSTLLHNAVNNIVALGPQAALTGPAARGDLALVAAQGDAVTLLDTDAGAAYQVLSRLAGKLAGLDKPLYRDSQSVTLPASDVSTPHD
jgi:predicted short-subunit dehydrogenase-like oxidoreductase (DUF2520 family)